MKSNVSDFLKLIEVVYTDATIKCIADVSDLRDLDTIRSRVKDEGFSFLTITLPKFCQDFEKSLAAGFIDSTCFRSFRKFGSIPVFLRGMISQIFNHETGRIYDELNEDTPTIVESVRQICLTFKKVEIDCTPSRRSAAFTSFTELEQSLSSFHLPDNERRSFTAVAHVLWDSAIGSIQVTDCRPRHGPGATAEGISGNLKYSWQSWYERLEPYFPFLSNAYPLGVPEDSPEFEKLTLVPEDAEVPVRVIGVPKTLKGPRIIAIEPVCMQFVQQGIRDVLYNVIESYWLTAGHINFRDQTVNQSLAMSSSRDGQLATIDLSDASDRVPHDLAMEMFRSNPDLLDSIDACRSTRAELPDGTLVAPLKKFASMGSALCFPIEAMYFYTICVVALLKESNLPVSQRNIFNVTRDVYVYGDDIIVPSTNAIAVLDYLQRYNCKVNTAKTFVSGSFRESCGVDAFDGYDVSPTYVRQLPPENRQQASQLISWTATANLFYLKGYWRTATYLWNFVEKFVGSLPHLTSDYIDGLSRVSSALGQNVLPELVSRSAGLGRTSFLGKYTISRWNIHTHRFEVKAWCPSPVYRTDKLDGYAALSKSLLKLEDLKNPLVSRDALHLEHSARHGAVALKHRWLPST